MRLRALAKINLGLDVIRKREDGYHEVRMIMQTIRMYDQLDITRALNPGIRLTTNLPYLPVNENNLVYKAAKLLMDEFEIKDGLSVQLKKVIPVSAGMAGGSSDAAAALVGVNKIFSLGLSRQELMERATLIGADVPYCVMRGTALAEGIGEILTPLPPVPKGYVLVGKPGISVSTKMVYGKLDAAGLEEHPDIDGMVEALKQNDFKKVAAKLGNVLETVTVPAYPIISEIKKKMIEWGAVNALMSGSGPTVFGLFDDREKAEYASEKLKKSRLVRQSFLTTFYNVPNCTGKERKNGGNTNDI
ncbi:MAG: 4-(cytidine 5'-diphospho)-2-C-methyl-D-erythritol kinase [Ruminococcus sp.]|jgi:4-diphosphocytidyl-2-C-methyl-D-erythritol kinase